MYNVKNCLFSAAKVLRYGEPDNTSAAVNPIARICEAGIPNLWDGCDRTWYAIPTRMSPMIGIRNAIRMVFGRAGFCRTFAPQFFSFIQQNQKMMKTFSQKTFGLFLSFIGLPSCLVQRLTIGTDDGPAYRVRLPRFVHAPADKWFRGYYNVDADMRMRIAAVAEIHSFPFEKIAKN